MKKDIVSGFALILLAVYILGNGLGILPNIPWFRILGSVFFLLVILKGILKGEIFLPVMAACCLAWMYDHVLKIEAITPFPLFFAGILVSMGLSLIFKKRNLVNIRINDKNAAINDIKQYNSWQDGGHIILENNFSSISKYVDTESFCSAKLENNFGSANIYFNNATMADGRADVHVENNFGQMNLYLPNTWGVRLKEECAFGAVRVIGSPNADIHAPCICLDVECNFGSVNLYFE